MSINKKKHYFMDDGSKTENKGTPNIQLPDGTTYAPGIDTSPELRKELDKTDPNWDGKQWIALPETRMLPQEDRVIVLPDPAMEKSAGGIIVADAYKDRHVPARGTIISVGPGKDVGNNSILFKIYQLLYSLYRMFCLIFRKDIEPMDPHIAIPAKRGDRVMYGHYAGVPVEDPDDPKKVYLIMRWHDIFVKL